MALRRKQTVDVRTIVMCLIGLSVILTSCSDQCSTGPGAEPRWEPEPGWRSLGLEDMTVTSLELDHPYLYACAGRNGLYRGDVTKRDVEWEYLGLASFTYPHIHGGWVQDVLVLDRNTILAGTCFYPEGEGTFPPGIHRSEDNGRTWSASDDGIVQDNGDFCCPARLNMCDDYIFVASWSCGTFKSEDLGLHWEYSGARLDHWYGAEWLEHSPADCSIIWQAGPTAIEESRIAVSSDHGENWESVQLNGSRFFVTAMTVDPMEPHTAYFGSFETLFRTTDLGSSFEVILELPERESPRALCYGRDSGHLFAAVDVLHADGDEYVIYEILGGSAIVDTLTIPLTGFFFDMVNDNEHQVVYVSGEGGVYQYVY